MHKHKQDSIFSPLSRARGLGASHHGVDHWLHQRITAITNFILMSWLIWSVVHFSTWDYATFTAWLQQPVNAVLMILAVISTFYHAALGVQVIAEDYLSCRVMLMVKVIGSKLFFLAAAVACIFSILKISFGV